MTHDLLWGMFVDRQFWHLVPLVVVVSLIYGASRHEAWWDILDHSLRFGIWILGFLAVIFVLLFLVSWGL